MADDIIFRQEGAVGRITLNRPNTLNALTLGMCSAMLQKLEEWAGLSSIQSVLVDAAPGRAFCAGGDMRAIWEWAKTKNPRALEFFRTEYRLNAAIKRFPKPYVALIDGIVMGGGAGISVHGSHRVATENTVFAMPETALGFFTDVGGSYFLSRVPGALGMYLGLTGARLNAADMLDAGLATHFLLAAHLRAIVEPLMEGASADGVLMGWSDTAGAAPLAAHRAAIDRAFSAPSIETILEALGQEGDWGAQTSALLIQRSPTSLKLVHRLLNEGKERNLEECLDMELAIAERILDSDDFREGVRAVLIDKDQRPKWRPARLDEVSEETIARFFAQVRPLA